MIRGTGPRVQRTVPYAADFSQLGDWKHWPDPYRKIAQLQQSRMSTTTYDLHVLLFDKWVRRLEICCHINNESIESTFEFYMFISPVGRRYVESPGQSPRPSSMDRSGPCHQ
jgi:hypothetical protein